MWATKGAWQVKHLFRRPFSVSGRSPVSSASTTPEDSLFYWYEDGELRTTFEGPAVRYGSTPDDLIVVMREVGFALSDRH
ncbi:MULTISPECIES: DUF6461 domain-containing protein [unclassified Streptomyces]|uniref:DUF6461 domain-containing protein n=1 Tax=unclassified Streptomyces TaxID=2593676 RepID=UPI0038157EF1